MRLLRSAVLAAVLATQVGAAGAGAQSDDLLYIPLLDAIETETADALDDTLPRYDIDATFAAATATDLATLTGTVALDYVNATGGDLAELNVRLYPNNLQYGAGGMTLDGLTIDGEVAEGTLAVDDTLLTVPLDAPLADGAALDLVVAFETTVPTDPAQGYGMFKYDPTLDVYSLAHWFPMLAGIDADGAWVTDPLSENGDPVFSLSLIHI